MRKNYGIISLAAVGAIIIAFTVTAFFLMGIEKTTLNWCALGFLLLSEIVLFSGLIALKYLGENHSKVFSRAGVSFTLLLYFNLTLLSMLFVRAFDGKPGRFILLQIGIIALVSIIAVSMLAFSRRIGGADQRTHAAMSFMNGCESRMAALLSNAGSQPYQQQLNALYESIKYADKVGGSSLDTDIAMKLGELEAALSGGAEDIKGITDALDSLLKRRKDEISQAKRGGF